MNFNPRSYKRSDSSSKSGYASENISIHAPTRGATCLIVSYARFPQFQSTLLQEERLSLQTWHLLHHHYFNPRSYKRSDRSWNWPYINYIISIHAPTRGATITGAVLCLLNRYFNPRSYKRSDDAQTGRCNRDCISIHAPTRGATQP